MQNLINLVINLIIDTSYSWVRMFAALGISIFIAFFLGILIALSKTAEKYLMPIIDILQTIPILAFFPFAIFIIVGFLPGVIGINFAVIFLIITSMLWNIIFGVYESIKTLPNEFNELSKIYKMGIFKKIKEIYFPASLARIVEQSMLSWSIGLFYLVSSEIFSTGSLNYQVKHGIGVAIAQLAASGNTIGYLIALLIFVIFVVITRFLFFGTLEKYVDRKTSGKIEKQISRKAIFHKFINYTKREERIFLKVFKKSEKHKKIIHYKEIISKKNNEKKKELLIILGIVIFAIILLFLTNTVNYEFEVLEALAASFLRIWFAFIFVFILSILISVYIIFISKNQSKYITLFQVLASIPATILLPEIVITFGKLNNGPEIVAFIIFVLSGIWYMIFSIVGSGKVIEKNIFEVKKLFGIKGILAWKNIYVNAILPGVITGGITAIAAEWNASILAESFGNVHVGLGLGFLLDNSLANNNLLLMSIALINMTVMIIIVNKFVWKRFYDKVSERYR
ncbi:MAG: ABC transporter permease subunit [Candidatus Micrarchaeaceae archaeon]